MEFTIQDKLDLFQGFTRLEFPNSMEVSWVEFGLAGRPGIFRLITQSIRTGTEFAIAAEGKRVKIAWLQWSPENGRFEYFRHMMVLWFTDEARPHLVTREVGSRLIRSHPEIRD